MRRLILALLLLATPALAQDEPSFLERRLGTDTAESDAEQGSLLERLIEDSLSGAGRSVSVTGFRGALSGQATLDSLTISDADGIWLTLNDATLDWNRGALFRGRLEVTELSAREILLPRLAAPAEREAPSPEAGRFQLPELPVSVEIGRIAAERVELGEPLIGIAAVISMEGALSLADGDGAADLDITRLDQPGAISLDAGFQNATGNLRLDLTVSEEEDGIIATLAGLPGSPSVDFSIQGEAPISDFTADIRLATDGVERLSGQVTLGETEDARRIAANIGGDIAPVFAPQYRAFFGDALTLNTEALLYEDGRIVLPTLELQARELVLDGSLEIGADRLPDRIDIVGRIAPETGDGVLLPLGGAETRIGRANLSIQFDATQSEDWQVGFRIIELERDGLTLDEARVTGIGRIAAGTPPRVSGDIAFNANGLSATDALTQAIGDAVAGTARIDWAGGPVTIQRFTLNARDLQVQGGGELDADTVRATTTLAANRIANFSSLAGRPLSGRADLAVSGSINILTQAFDVTAEGQTQDLIVDDPRADAVLAGTARLDVDAVRDTDGLRITLTTLESDAAQLTGQASLRSGGSSAALNGTLRETSLVIPGLTGPSDIQFSGQESDTRDWTIDAKLTAPAISASVNGLLSNIYDLPAFQGTVEAGSTDLSVLSEVAGRPLAGQIRLHAEGGANADLTRALIDGTVTARDLSVGDTRIDPLLLGSVTLELEGGRTDDRIDIARFVLDSETLDADFSGIVTELFGTPTVEGRIAANGSDLSLLSGLAGRPLAGTLDLIAEGGAKADLTEVRIDGSANGQDISVGIAEVDRLLSGAITLAIDAGRQGDRFDSSNLNFASDALTVETTGALGSNGERLTVRARLADISPYVQGLSGALTVDGTVGRDAETLVLDIDATGPGGTQATISGTLAQDASNVDLAVNGTAPLGLANRFIVPRSLAGTSRFDLRVAGPPALESVEGEITLSNARLSAPTFRTALEDITGRISLTSGRATLDIDTRFENGGRISVSGPVGLTAPNTAALQIDLAGARVTDPQLYETTIDGRINIDGPLAGGARIAGALNLGETNIRIPSSGIGGAGAIPEVTHINEPPPVRGTRRKAGLIRDSARDGNGVGPVYPLDIRVSAPNRLFVRGRGLDSEFGGALRITGSTENIVPIGAFELIRGRLDILGRRLALEQARITVQGGFIPFLDIRASTDVEDTQINVEVFGPADNPEIRFSSSPELPQEEVLARLIFGRGLETLSPLQAARLALAVRTLAGQGGEGVVGKIRNTVGLADLDVTTSEDGSAAVRAGAYIGENIYSDVEIDSEGETQLNLNLDVSPSLTVRGGVTNDGETSLGIFFERDY